ncbi:hypothetical protein B5M09_009982 [Aphanomyces astaci]|uniref:Uncharacterized protein n=1 Tax=Aphanomyces astaci TaxID=112090 RepID=A0A3R7WGP4_APHAT|nr:hypothetical protein B5M09_009982 [Aphanomyces astaci]
MAAESASILYGSLPLDDNFGGSTNDEGNMNVHVDPLTIHLADDVMHVKAWEFPGWGSATSESADPAELKDLDATLVAATHAHRLGEWPATAICGNDILSSCLYTAGIVAVRAGKLAPVAMAVVAAILYLYRYIYGEVVNAIPLNGGSYNALLNTTTKRIASVAAALGILSYVATGAESAGVALVIFVVHTTTLIVLCGMSVVFLIQDKAAILRANFHADYPDVSVAGATYAVLNMWWGVAIFNPSISFLSLAVLPLPILTTHKDTVLSAMAKAVGGRGLETWVAVDAFVVLSGAVLTAYVGITGLVRRLALDRILPSGLLTTNRWRGTNHWIVLAYFGISASLVVALRGQVDTLSGVYTFAFLALMILFGVGCMLLKFKRSDLLKQHAEGRENAPWGVVVVGVGCMVLALGGNLVSDPAVLSIACVYFSIVMGIVMVMFERVFVLRLLLALVTAMWPKSKGEKKRTAAGDGNGAELLNGHRNNSSGDQSTTGDDIGNDGGGGYVDESSSAGASPFHALSSPGMSIARAIHAINGPPILFFCKRPHLPTLNKAILYVRQNEQTAQLYIVHVTEKREDMDAFASVVSLFDRIYPKLKIDFVQVVTHGYVGFGPAVVEWVSRKYHTPKNLMFIKQPSHDCAHTIANNMLYPSQDREMKQLTFTCRNCSHNERVPEHCIYVNKLVKDARNQMDVLPEDIIDDPTLQRDFDVVCPMCGQQGAAFIRSHDGVKQSTLALIWICLNRDCQTDDNGNRLPTHRWMDDAFR